jgi:hypothetical protein
MSKAVYQPANTGFSTSVRVAALAILTTIPPEYLQAERDPDSERNGTPCREIAVQSVSVVLLGDGSHVVLQSPHVLCDGLLGDAFQLHLRYFGAENALGKFFLNVLGDFFCHRRVFVQHFFGRPIANSLEPEPLLLKIAEIPGQEVIIYTLLQCLGPGMEPGRGDILRDLARYETPRPWRGPLHARVQGTYRTVVPFVPGGWLSCGRGDVEIAT